MKKRFFVLTAVLFSIQLSAQVDTTGVLLDEAIVTANKFEQKQTQTGKVVTVINKEELERSNGKSLGQLLQEHAGVVVNGSLNAPGTVQTVFMRGAGSGRAIILIDGIPISDPSMINNEFDLNFIPVQDIERIEILRGAQSTVYGSDAIAGAINIITIKKDISKQISGKLTALVGNRESFKTHVGIYGKIKQFSYNARFNFIHTAGFSAAHDSTGNKNFDRDGLDGDMFQARVQYDITDALNVSAWLQRSRYNADIDANVFIDETDYYFRHRNTLSGLGLQYKKGKLDLHMNYQHGVVHRLFRNDSGYVSISGISYENNSYSGATNYLEAYGNIKINDWLSLLTGVDYRKVKMKQDYYALSLFGPFSTSFEDTSVNQLSGYTSAFLTLAEKKLNIEAGFRYNDHSRYGSNTTYTFNPSYKISGKISLFASIASGFKTPSLYQLYDGFSGNPDLKPETSTNYEAGISFHSKKIGTRLVYFHREIEDGLDFDYNLFKYYNFVNQSVNGLELEFKIIPSKKITFNGNYSLITGEEQTQSRKIFNDTTYAHLLRRPKHSINLNLGIHLTPRLFASLSGRYASKRFDTGGFLQDDVLLKEYVLLNAYSEYKWTSRFKIFVDLQNITDNKFFELRGYNSLPLTVSGGVHLEL